MGGDVIKAEVDEGGIVGDRIYALVDVETGKVVTAKSVKQFPDLLQCRATYVEPPRAGGGSTPVRISLPNGTSIVSGSGQTASTLSAHFGRDVKLVQAAPENFTIDQYHPDVADVDSEGRRDTFVEQKLGSALFAQLGMPSPVRVGMLFDMFPISVLTTSTLDRLRELDAETTFDPRRFRMNVVVKTSGAGFIENEWIDRELTIGGTVRLHIAMPDPRCVMTTLAQSDLPRETDVLRTLARHNRLEIGPGVRFPCAGVYAAVTAGGSVAVGDNVALG